MKQSYFYDIMTKCNFEVKVSLGVDEEHVILRHGASTLCLPSGRWLKPTLIISHQSSFLLI